MATFLWLVITTIIGALVGHYAFDATGFGALAGFLIGLALRIGVELDLLDMDL